MVSLEHDQLFVVKSDSFLHHALNLMEDAGDKVLKSLWGLVDDGNAPFQITFEGNFRGLTAIPNSKREAIPMITPMLIHAFEAAGSEILKNKKHKYIVVPAIVTVGEDREEVLRKSQITEIRLEAIAHNFGALGIESNWLHHVSKERPGAATENPDKAVLTINGKSFYPEAYKVFADWVIALPPHVPQCGNNYTPFDCRPVRSAEVKEMTIGIELSEYRHNHAEARKRIINLDKIELSHYRR